MSKPRILSLKKKANLPAPTPPLPEPSSLPAPPLPPVSRPRIVSQDDYSLLLRQIDQREKARAKLQDQSLKDIEPAQAGPGMPLQMSVGQTLQKAVDRIKKGRKPATQKDVDL